jgi:MoxR-like ATPase
VHVFDEDSIHAINGALAAGRPLLLRGEPGTGKSQLARAAAQELGWPLVSIVIDSRVESRDLLWSFDAVARLAAAQIASATHIRPEALDEVNFVDPGPLWWAFNWADAKRQQERYGKPSRFVPPEYDIPSSWSSTDSGQSVVVLIDEIDKADPDVPNGLLEALGEGRFCPLGRASPVRVPDTGHPPLVIITSNEECALPDAFLRRCFALQLALPEDPKDPDKLQRYFSERIGPAHFPEVDARVLQEAARQLSRDRREASDKGWPKPGQAEYLDLIRAVVRPCPNDMARQLEWLGVLSKFVYQKHSNQVPTR